MPGKGGPPCSVGTAPDATTVNGGLALRHALEAPLWVYTQGNLVLYRCGLDQVMQRVPGCDMSCPRHRRSALQTSPPTGHQHQGCLWSPQQLLVWEGRGPGHCPDLSARVGSPAWALAGRKPSIAQGNAVEANIQTVTCDTDAKHLLTGGASVSGVEPTMPATPSPVSLGISSTCA